MPRRATFAALILAATAPGALSLNAMLGDAFVALPVPSGFCHLTAEHEYDGTVESLTSRELKQKGIRLLAMYADCGQLEQARTRRRGLPDDMAEYRVNIPEMAKPPGESIAQACARLRTEANDASRGNLGARLADAIEKLNTSEMGIIGVLAETPDACYAAILHKLRIDRTIQTRVGAFAVTIVSDRTKGQHYRSMSVYHSALYRDAGTIDAVLARLKRDVAALIAANP